MNRTVIRALCLATLATGSACGEAPPGDFPQAGDPGPSPNLQQLSFTGVADPATGRLQVIMQPMAIGKIPESADGNALTVAANTVQVYGPTVNWVVNNTLYPAGCNKGAPMLMQANVEVFSGYTEQLRNVYANVSAKSASPTACATNALGSFAGAIGTSFGAYLYLPLNTVTTAGTAIKRSVTWSMALSDASTPFWFTGDIWAEVIPAPPIILTPDNSGLVHTAGATANVTFSWTNDATANGTDPETFGIARPTMRGARFTIQTCNTGATFVPANCGTATVIRVATPTVSTTRNALTLNTWYQWSLESWFRLPGSNTSRYGVKTTRVFHVVSP